MTEYNGKCLEECPDGYFEDLEHENFDGSFRTQCIACHQSCMQCRENDDDYFVELINPALGYKNCCGNQCKTGYYRKDTGLDKIECLQQCPDNYYGDDDTLRCIEKWTVIAYQDAAFSESDFELKVNAFNLEEGAQERGVTVPLQNFFNLDVLDLPESSFSRENEPTIDVWKVCENPYCMGHTVPTYKSVHFFRILYKVSPLFKILRFFSVFEKNIVTIYR